MKDGTAAVVAFTAALSLFVGFVGGNLMGADSIDVRQWISALSGIAGGLIAAVVAIYIGFTQLRPLLVDQAHRMEKAYSERATECTTAFLDLSEAFIDLAGSLVALDQPNSIRLLLPAVDETDEEANDRIIETLNEPGTKIDTMQRLVLTLSVNANTSPEFRKQKQRLFIDLVALARAVYEYRGYVYEKMQSLGETADGPPTKAHIQFAISTQKAIKLMNEVPAKLEAARNSANRMYVEIRNEQLRVETLLHAD